MMDWLDVSEMDVLLRLAGLLFLLGLGGGSSFCALAAAVNGDCAFFTAKKSHPAMISDTKS
jgi:hypothetical protein